VAADVAWSVLDLAPVAEGSDVGQALRNSIDLVQRAERMGFLRYWVAEHHNMPGIASSAPAVLLAHLASVTETMRLGSGGVMLPTHAPLAVAEQFGMLEALHPGRIDLGIGRAPGTDQLTALALRRSPEALQADDFPSQLRDLMDFFSGDFPADHPFRQITAVPGLGNQPALWLLGSSGFSAQVAGLLGLPFSFAHHFSAQNTVPALRLYREHFRPSAVLPEPYAMIGVSVLAAETDERAQWLAGSGRLSFVRLRQGRPGRFPSPEEAAAHEFTPTDRLLLEQWTSSAVVGGPETVARQLDELIARTGVQELMVTTLCHDHADRVRSYEIVAELAGLTAVGAERGA
jgi:luciferase family oxidoreductase group 1